MHCTRPPRLTLFQQKLAATQERMSSARFSCAFFAQYGSVKSWRARQMASPSPASSRRSATSGVVMRPTSSTAFDDTSRILRA